MLFWIKTLVVGAWGEHVQNLGLGLSVHNWPTGVDVDQIVHEASQAWDFPWISTEVIYTGMVRPDFPTQPNIQDQVNVLYLDHWEGGFLGETKKRLVNNSLREFDIRIETEGLDVFMLRKILMHELGHVYGLDHSNRLDAVMFPGIEARHHFTRSLIPAGNHLVTQDDAVNLYIQEMEALPWHANRLLETLNLLLPFLPPNVGEIVRFADRENSTR